METAGISRGWGQQGKWVVRGENWRGWGQRGKWGGGRSGGSGGISSGEKSYAGSCCVVCADPCKVRCIKCFRCCACARSGQRLLLHRHSQVIPYQYICSPEEALALHKPKSHGKCWCRCWRMHENLASLTGRSLQFWRCCSPCSAARSWT